MNRYKTLVLLAGLSVVLALSGPSGSAQLGPTGSAAPAFDRTRIPAALQTYARALGRRVASRGKERVILDGQFTDSSGSQTPARVTVELPGRVRLEGMRRDGAAILFDGEAARAAGYALNETDQTILDAFALDSIEGMLGLVTQGAGHRVLGRGFGPDPSKPEQAGGPVFDIVEVTAPRPTRGDHPVETRRYYFDSPSGLLVSVRHTDGVDRVETRFSDWGAVEGEMYPGRIEHYDGGDLIFSFTTQAVGARPASDIGTFRLP